MYRSIYHPIFCMCTLFFACENKVNVVLSKFPEEGAVVYNPGDQIATVSTRDPNEELPLVTLDASQVCEGTEFYNAEGERSLGTASCSGNQSFVEACNQDGQQNCWTSDDFPAVDVNILSSRIMSRQIVAGTAGTAKSSDLPSCTKDGEQYCQANADFPAVDTSTIASKIIAGQKIAGVAGASSFPNPGQVLSGTAYGAGGNAITGTLLLPAANAVRFGSGSYGDPGAPVTPSYQADFPDPANVLTSDTVNGASGTLGVCSAEGAIGCVASAAPYAAALIAGAASKIISGQSAAGINGNVTLPAQGLVLSGSSYGVSGTSLSGTLTLPTASNVLTGSGSYGNPSSLMTPSYTPDFPSVGNVRDTDSVNQLSGTLAVCSSDGQLGCVTDNSYPALSMGSVTAGNIRSGVSIAGITGDYPSATHPLVSDTLTADLLASTFTTQVRSATAFEYWTSAGVRQTGSGDADIAAANIFSGVDIFGVTGTKPGVCRSASQAACIADTMCSWSAGTCSVNAMNIRAGVVLAGTTGALKMNCRTRANSAMYNTDAMPPGNSGATSGSIVNWWDTIDNGNNEAASLPSEVPAGWSSDNSCGKELWRDETPDGACDSAADDCVMRDLVTGLLFTEKGPVSGAAPSTGWQAWSSAVNLCNNLVYGGRSDWRLPTQTELMVANSHGIRGLGYKGGTARPLGDTLENNDYFNAGGSGLTFWSGTSVSTNTSLGWWSDIRWGTVSNIDKTNSSVSFYCVAP